MKKVKNKRLERPQIVSNAVNLLWLSIILGVINGALGYSGLSQMMPIASLLFVQIIGLLVNIFFIYMISEGKNWARVVFLVLFILGLFSVPTGLKVLMNISSMSAIISLAIIVLQAIALVLLFKKESSMWFTSKKN